MRVRIYSDLHNEFEAWDAPDCLGTDLVILAGDIDKKARGIKWANDTFSCPVAYINGNHEFYDGHIDRTLQKMKDAALSHVHVLEKRETDPQRHQSPWYDRMDGLHDHWRPGRGQ